MVKCKDKRVYQIDNKIHQCEGIEGHKGNHFITFLSLDKIIQEKMRK